MRRAQILVLILSGLGAMGVGSCVAQSASCPRDAGHAEIVTDGGTHCFRVDIADSPEERRQGLMFVRHMEDDRGMLFLFERLADQSFWMRNTYISLDIIFISVDGRIVNIAARTEPLSEESIPSAGPVAAVLEINGGLAGKLGIEAGDLVRHPGVGAGSGGP